MNREYDKNNIFAKMLRGEMSCKKVYEDENILAFNDINPQAPVHILVIPKKECICFNDFVKNSSDNEIANFFKTVQKIAENLDVKAYKIIANCGEEADQMVFHYHLHILGYK